MPRFTNLPADVPEDSQPLLDWVAAAMPTRVPLPLHYLMAASTPVLEGYVGLRKAIGGVSIDQKLQFLIMAVAAGPLSSPDSSFEQDTMSILAVNTGWAPDEVAAGLRGDPLGDEKTDSILAVVHQISQSAGVVDESTWKRARSAGWGTAELIDVFALVINTTFTAYFCNYIQYSPPADALEEPNSIGTPVVE